MKLNILYTNSVWNFLFYNQETTNTMYGIDYKWLLKVIVLDVLAVRDQNTDL